MFKIGLAAALSRGTGSRNLASRTSNSRAPRYGSSLFGVTLFRAVGFAGLAFAWIAGDWVGFDGLVSDRAGLRGVRRVSSVVSPFGPRRAAAADGPGALELDDPVEPLAPLKPRTEQEADRVQAEGLYMAARAAEQKQDYATALRCYQRAYRSDPRSAAALREIPSLAFSLDRPAVAVRYALLESDTETMEPVALRRLAQALQENGSNEQAMRLLERLEKLEAHEKPSAGRAAQWMQLGRLRFLARQYDGAADSFAKVIQALDHPGDYGLDDSHRRRLIGKGDLSYQLFGETFLSAGRLDEALAAFEKANSISHRDGVLAYNKARVAEKKGQPTAALELLQKFFDERPGGQGAGPYELLARLLQETGAADQLDARLEKLLAADPNDTPLVYFAAKRFEERGQWDQAEQLFLKLLDGDPRRTPAEVLEGLVNVYRHKRDNERLLDTLGDAVGRDDSLAALGDQAKRLAGEPDTIKALAELVRSQAAAPESDPHYSRPLAVALLAQQANDFDTAGEFFKAAIAAAPQKKAELLILWGSGLLLADRTAQAIKVLRRGIDEQALPDDSVFAFYLSGALELDGHTDEALMFAHRAAEARPDSPRFQSRPAWILYHARRYDAAKQAYEAVLRKFDANYESDDVRESLRDARMVLSNIDVVEHRMAAAEEWLEQVLDEFPDNVGAMNDLGYLWADENKHLPRALAMIQKAVKEEPTNMAYLDSLGWALFRLGRYPEAIPPLKAATADPKADPTVFDHLGDAQEKAGDVPAAIEAWRRALAGLESEKNKDKDKDADKARAVREKLARVHAPASAEPAATPPAAGADKAAPAPEPKQDSNNDPKSNE